MVGIMDRVGPVIQSALDSAVQTLTEDGRPVDGVVSMQPGNTVAWDNCCENGGTLWARLISLVPKYAKDKTPCMISVQVRFAVGVVRCVHVVDDDGSGPTEAEMDEDTLQVTKDADALFRSIQDNGWDGTYLFSRSLRIETGTPLGPEGNCAGFEWTASAQVLMVN